MERGSTYRLPLSFSGERNAGLVRHHRGADMSLHRIFRLKPALAGFLLVCIVFTANAQDYIPAGQPVPQNIRWVGDTVAGADTRASAFWRNAAGATSHHNFPVPVSSSTLGKLAKGALTRGIPLPGSYLVLKDLVNGAGWVIDELGKQVTTPGSPSETIPQGDYAWCMSGGAVTQTRCTSLSTPANLIPVAQMAYPANGPVINHGVHYSSPNLYFFTYQSMNQILASKVLMTTNTMQNTGSGSSPTVITDMELGEFIKANPEIVNAVLIDPVTGAPIRTQELVDALNNLRRGLETANGQTPGPDLEPETAPGQTETPNETAWPGFCDWATVVCDFINWVKAPEEQTEPPEVPFEEQAMPNESWSSGLGGGTCPAPESVTVSLPSGSQSIQFEYDPVCQFATSMRPVIIAMALLLVPMIVGGFRGSKDA